MGTFQKDNFTELRQSFELIKAQPLEPLDTADKKQIPGTLVASLNEDTSGPQLVIPSGKTSSSLSTQTNRSQNTDVTTQTKKTSRSTRTLSSEGFEDSEDGNEKIFGILEVDNALQEEIVRTKSHVELHLEAVDRKDVQGDDTRVLDFRFPTDEEFSIEAGTLRGKYQLFARIYRRKDIHPVASIPHVS